MALMPLRLLTEMLHNQQLYLETKDVDRYGRTVGVI